MAEGYINYESQELYLGAIEASSATEALGKAFDAIKTYEHTVVGHYFYLGMNMFMAYKYSSSNNYGVIIAINFASFRDSLILNVDNGVKTYRKFTITSV